MKKAVLVVSFGTSYKETREKTIEACENKIKEGLKEYDFFRAFTSNMIIRKLKNRDGLHIENPVEALDRLYKEGYLKILKNQIPISEGQEYSGYYKNLWQAGMEFQDLVENKSINKFPYLLYYDDLDGDGKPELGINQGYMYILDYELGDKEFNVLYSRDSKVFEKIFGSGQIWCHYKIWDDTITIDEYDLLNRGTYWYRTVLELQ